MKSVAFAEPYDSEFYAAIHGLLLIDPEKMSNKAEISDLSVNLLVRIIENLA
jgi:hypothetical protein